MTPDHLTLLAAVIAAAGGGGGVVAWAKYRGDQRIGEFDRALTGFEKLLAASDRRQEDLEARMESMKTEMEKIRDCKLNLERDIAVKDSKITTAFGHIILLRAHFAQGTAPELPLLIEAEILEMMST